MKWCKATCVLWAFIFSAVLSFGQQAVPAPAPQATNVDPGPPPSPKIGPFDISLNWRERVEGWDWFKGNTGDSDYAFWHSLLRVGIGQKFEKVDWFVEGEQVFILGLPTNAVVAAPQGQLGLGGNYYAANNKTVNNVGGFLKQAFVDFKQLGPTKLKLGRFEFFDGGEVKPQDPTLAWLQQNRIASRLIANFGFTAVQRTFDGGSLAWKMSDNDSFTFFAARPTEGVFQVEGMDELDIQIYYGAYNHAYHYQHGSSDLRVFGIGYVDDRTNVPKVDNRPSAVRNLDHGKIALATYGADYLQVFNTASSGKFDLLFWGALQGGSWGSLAQHAGAFVTEAGWQPPVKMWKPWLSAGYSYGSGDSNPNDGTHGTFFQILPTPRQYARFPFYNMMNNGDMYGTLGFVPTSKLMMRSEFHWLRLANPADFWYSGGGAFQPSTFGYTGRPSNGNQGIADVWDLSASYQFTRYLEANVYYGHAWGRGVIASIYPKDSNGQLAYFETNVHF